MKNYSSAISGCISKFRYNSKGDGKSPFETLLKGDFLSPFNFHHEKMKCIPISYCYYRPFFICILLVFILVFSACGPTVHYLGDSFSPSQTIEIFYDERDVEREYRTIGRMTHDKFIDYHVDIIKKSMIEEAKKRGGDGIIFTDAFVSRENEVDGDRLSVTAEIIRYR